MRIAYFSPLPPATTGVADYSRELLPHLAGLAQLELFVDRSGAGEMPAMGNYPVRPYQAFERLAEQYRACIYHLGNDRSHEYILETSLRFPGFAVLHDASIHPLIVALTIGRGDLVGYIREMGYAYGRQGMAEARAAYVGRYYRYQDFPLCQRIADLSLGLIVHSKYAAGIVRSVRPQAKIAVIPHGVSTPSVDSKQECRKRLGLDGGEFIVAALGLANPDKRLEPALKAFARLLASRPDCRFLIVGEVSPTYDLTGIVERLQLGERVVLTGRATMEDFYRYASASDVCLALRFPTSGETSGALLRAMSVGRPVVVSQIGSFAELPAGTCLHVPVDESEEDRLLESLDLLAGDEGLRVSLGQQAEAFVKREHSWQQAASGYLRFIRETLAGLGSDSLGQLGQ